MFSGAQLIGTFAACCTTAAYVPQLYKCWTKGTAADLSLHMLLVLASGLALWIVYGVMQHDLVVIAANIASLALLGALMIFKVREMMRARRHGGASAKADA